jgi:hypothetical protein
MPRGKLSIILAGVKFGTTFEDATFQSIVARSRIADQLISTEYPAMTEAEWLACTDPVLLLEFLQGKASDRKLRLYAVACFRGVWDSITNVSSQEAIQVLERYAEGQATAHELGQANWSAEAAIFDFDRRLERYEREQNGIRKGWLPLEDAIESPFVLTKEGNEISLDRASYIAAAIERATSESSFIDTQVDRSILDIHLIHDIFGNPFRPSSLKPAWLTPNVVGLANGIYDDRAFDRLPILADALEEAGCDDEEILLHCRRPGEHVRGCWVVDLLTGRK